MRDASVVSDGPDSAVQARAIVHLVLDPRLQSRVAERPDAFAERFAFCLPGRELLALGVEMRARMGEERFARALRIAVGVASELLDRSGRGGADADRG